MEREDRGGTRLNTNSRIRHLLCASLRASWEDGYRGDQRHALDYDRDFSAALAEEFLRTRVLNVLRASDRPYGLRELTSELMMDKRVVAKRLLEMFNEGLIHITHKNREAYYTACA